MQLDHPPARKCTRPLRQVVLAADTLEEAADEEAIAFAFATTGVVGAKRGVAGVAGAAAT